MENKIEKIDSERKCEGGVAFYRGENRAEEESESEEIAAF